MQILDEDQPRLPLAELESQLGHRFLLAAIAGGVVHGVVQRPQLHLLRQIEQVVEVDPPLGVEQLGLEGGIRGRSRRGGSPKPEQTACERRDRVVAARHAEIEHQARMENVAERLGSPLAYLQQAGLADAGLAPDIHGLAGPGLEAGLQHAPDLLNLGGRQTAGSWGSHTPISRKARTGWLRPFTVSAPSSAQFNRSASAWRTASETRMVPVSDSSVSREARFTESPVML